MKRGFWGLETRGYVARDAIVFDVSQTLSPLFSLRSKRPLPRIRRGRGLGRGWHSCRAKYSKPVMRSAKWSYCTAELSPRASHDSLSSLERELGMWVFLSLVWREKGGSEADGLRVASGDLSLRQSPLKAQTSKLPAQGAPA
jgi:hypothetical protein